MYIPPTLTSIEELRPADVVADTLTKPIRLLASDFNDYYVKVQRSQQDAGVVKEWLAAHFLKLWELPVPDFTVVQILPEHVPVGFHPDYQPYHFDRPAFASRAEENALEVSKLLETPNDYQRNLSGIGGELIWLALFDVWISNNDRHANHYNLMYSAAEAPKFLPIDHGLTLDSIDYGNDPERQTENDNLSDSPVFDRFVTRKEMVDFGHGAAERRALFREKAEACKTNLKDIIAQMPEAWQLAKPTLHHDLQSTIFSDQWLATTWETYLGFLESAARR